MRPSVFGSKLLQTVDRPQDIDDEDAMIFFGETWAMPRKAPAETNNSGFPTGGGRRFD
jgi:hypothetical protein